MLNHLKNKKWLLRLIGLGFFVYVLTIIDIKQTIRIITDINLYIYAIVVLTRPVTSLIKGYRLKLLLSKRNIKIELRNLTAADLISSYLGTITPGRIGELYKLLFLKQRGFAYSQTIPSCVLDRILDIFSFFILSLAILPLSPIAVENALVINISVTLLFILLFLYILRKTKFIDRLLTKTLYAITPAEYKERLHENLMVIFGQVKSIKKEEIINPFLITLVWWAFYVLRNYLLTMAFGLTIPITILTFSLCLIGVLSFLPISFSGVGTRDAVLLAFFSQYGATNEQIIAYSVMVLFGRTVITGLYALVAKLYLRKNEDEKTSVEVLSPSESETIYSLE